MEVIPDIKNSIGYINVNQALSDVFGTSVSLVRYIGIGNGENDVVGRNDFDMILKYQTWYFILEIGDTRTKGMMNQGRHGGRVNIFIPDSEWTEGWAPYTDDAGIRYTFLMNKFPEKSETWDILMYGSLGYDLDGLRIRFQILKNYLDEQIRLKREEEDRNSFGF